MRSDGFTLAALGVLTVVVVGLGSVGYFIL